MAHHPWGVVLELAFDSDERLERFRACPSSAPPSTPSPTGCHGLVVYRGRGGGSSALVPRHPRPRPVADAAALPEPEPDRYVRLDSDPCRSASMLAGC